MLLARLHSQLCVFVVLLFVAASFNPQIAKADQQVDLSGVTLAQADDGFELDIDIEGLEGIDDGAKAEETTEEAQEPEKTVEVKAEKVEKQWEDMLYYIDIARPAYAKAYANALLANPEATPKTLYLLSVKYPKSMKTLRLAENVKGVDKIAKQILDKIQAGYGDWRTDADQIEESIRRLGTTPQAYNDATKLLAKSGEHAVPLLIQKLRDSSTPQLLRERIITILPKLGHSAVRPLAVALQTKDLKLVEIIADALSTMQYPEALPRLCQAYARKDVQNSKSAGTAVKSAIIVCGNGDRNLLTVNPANLFYKQANSYYEKAESLIPEKGSAPLVWFWKESLGLSARPVPAEIFCDVYAMRMARIALKYDSKFFPAIPLWLSACIRRQLELPAGQKDTLWPADAPKAEFYALATSPRYLQLVLSRALKDKNTGIAKVVISTLGKNTGPQSLVKPVDGKMPLVQAMSYDDQDVKFLAAETLAKAKPSEPFKGQSEVTALLIEALATKGDWAVKAANALEIIGDGSAVYDLQTSVAPLIKALKGDTKLQVAAANALAKFASTEAQQGLIDFALSAAKNEDVQTAALIAAGNSVHAYGNKATQAQAAALAKFVLQAKGSGKLRQAAARLLGTMNLSSAQMPEIILSTDKLD